MSRRVVHGRRRPAREIPDLAVELAALRDEIAAVPWLTPEETASVQAYDRARGAMEARIGRMMDDHGEIGRQAARSAWADSAPPFQAFPFW